MVQTSAVEPSPLQSGDLTGTPPHDCPDTSVLLRTGCARNALIVGDHGIGLMCAVVVRNITDMMLGLVQQPVLADVSKPSR